MSALTIILSGQHGEIVADFSATIDGQCYVYSDLTINVYPEGQDGPGGPGGPDDGDDDDCPVYEFAIGPDALVFEPGISPITVDLNSALSQLNIDPSIAEIEFEIENEMGGSVGSYSISDSNIFSIETSNVPDPNTNIIPDYIYIVDILSLIHISAPT